MDCTSLLVSKFEDPIFICKQREFAVIGTNDLTSRAIDDVSKVSTKDHLHLQYKKARAFNKLTPCPCDPGCNRRFRSHALGLPVI
jgi:hypothetical protein